MTTTVNNEIYHSLGDRWYEGDDDPVALLRAESFFRNPRIALEIESRLGAGPRAVLDIGCGAGFLTNYLATRGHQVCGLDAAEDSLRVAAHHDKTGQVRYVQGNAEHLPLEESSFDVVTCMDMLEHVEDPAQVVAQAARVLRPGGLFIYYTFNRTPLAWLIVIKGVEWFVRNTPPRLHVYRLFLKPEEMASMCKSNALSARSLVGLRPQVLHRSFWQMLITRRVPCDFPFTWTSCTLTGYMGIAQKHHTR